MSGMLTASRLKLRARVGEVFASFSFREDDGCRSYFRKSTPVPACFSRGFRGVQVQVAALDSGGYDTSDLCRVKTPYTVKMDSDFRTVADSASIA